MDEQRTTSPSLTFLPEGDLPPSMTYQLRHGTLPSENVCTENLTPFLKLLPCKSFERALTYVELASDVQGSDERPMAMFLRIVGV